MKKIINRIKSKLIDHLVATGRYDALREGLYDEVFCKSYCSVEVPSAVLALQAKENCARSVAIRKVILDRVITLREKDTINISDEQFEVFKNEINRPAHPSNKLMNTVHHRVSLDGGWRSRNDKVRIHVAVPLCRVIRRHLPEPKKFVDETIKAKLKEMGYNVE